MLLISPLTNVARREGRLHRTKATKIKKNWVKHFFNVKTAEMALCWSGTISRSMKKRHRKTLPVMLFIFTLFFFFFWLHSLKHKKFKVYEIFSKQNITYISPNQKKLSQKVFPKNRKIHLTTFKFHQCTLLLVTKNVKKTLSFTFALFRRRCLFWHVIYFLFVSFYKYCCKTCYNFVKTLKTKHG